ncbi:general stress protein [Sporosarcina aquimarina]|uniref:General stress protein n=1 Tax=Sporosarcina aquimarina TaxID=114975 RepID=A0ABU4FZK8_9BACL|nr:general stress protein [Sporosarcina aquimarina]MDW0108847.1 general stress protein [Sporosarcina aquimarina]
MESGKRFIGMFHTEQELMAKVQELKMEGYTDHQIFVIAKSEDDVKMLQSRTDAEIQTTHESWLDKFMDFMTGEDRVRSMMDDLGFSEDEKAGFYQDVNNGSLLLYVDEGNDINGQTQEVGRQFGMEEPAGDPNLGANTWVAPPGDGVTRTPEEPAFGEPVTGYTNTSDDLGYKEQPVSRSAVHNDELYDTPVQDKSMGNGELHTDSSHTDAVYSEPIGDDVISGNEITDLPAGMDPMHGTPVEEQPLQPEPPVKNPLHDKPLHAEPPVTDPLHDAPIHEEPVINEPLHDEPVRKEPGRRSDRHTRVEERSEFSVAADDSITNGLETTDMGGELGRDPEEERRRQEFQDAINDHPGRAEGEPQTDSNLPQKSRVTEDSLEDDQLDKRRSNRGFTL